MTLVTASDVGFRAFQYSQTTDFDLMLHNCTNRWIYGSPILCWLFVAPLMMFDHCQGLSE